MPHPHAREQPQDQLELHRWQTCVLPAAHLPALPQRRCRCRCAAAAALLPLRLTSLSRAATRVLKRAIALRNKQAYGFTTKSSSVFID
jgi:hypothetical protein